MASKFGILSRLIHAYASHFYDDSPAEISMWKQSTMMLGSATSKKKAYL
ncbi:hypothetical protein T01_1239 [Trichinella spiralis]|uniref:Uncharacterized protein n=1 Tax=Trichinella spiralis TaxID=6334 RepID=A0A0V1AMS0_TRISP|nr:hypothetical protein T01_1239 [Trichinella spiralis]